MAVLKVVVIISVLLPYFILCRKPPSFRIGKRRSIFILWNWESSCQKITFLLYIFQLFKIFLKLVFLCEILFARNLSRLVVCKTWFYLFVVFGYSSFLVNKIVKINRFQIILRKSKEHEENNFKPKQNWTSKKGMQNNCHLMLSYQSKLPLSYPNLWPKKYKRKLFLFPHCRILKTDQ